VFNGPVNGAAGLVVHGRENCTVTFNGTNSLTGSTTMTGGELDVNAGSSIGTGNLTMAQHNGGNTTLVLTNASQSVGNLSSTYDPSNAAPPNGSGTGPVFQVITLNGTALHIHQTVAADYGDNYALDSGSPFGAFA